MKNTSPTLHKLSVSTAHFALAASLMLIGIGGCKIEVTTEPAGHPAATTTTMTTSANPPAGSATATTGQSTRVMSYNIQFFDQKSLQNGDRLAKLKAVVADINPQVVAVQEVDDRAAMDLLFPADSWTVVIDDDSRDRQDLAFAVRKPLKVTNIPADLDADDGQFLAPLPEEDSFFPNRRDALFVKIAAPDGKPLFTAINIHAKARVGGRAKTAPRRIGASKVLLEAFKTKLPGEQIVLMGDFNDSPDDTSLNILEEGNPDAAPGDNTWPGPYLVNLGQPLWIKGEITEGANESRLDSKTGLLNNVFADARARNNDVRERDVNTGPIMFDQILVSPGLYKPGQTQAEIYKKPLALKGPGYSRPSDHLPIFADIP